MGHVSQDMLRAPAPAEGQSYESYLDGFRLLGRGFVVRELIRGGPRHTLPPRTLWPRMVATLALANELRARMVAAGARGLLVTAAYRPVGGEQDSQHKVNAALDLDLLPGDALDRVYAQVAAELWREHLDLRVGAGTYAPDGAQWTRRVHIDTGYRFRCWQGLPSRSLANGDGRGFSTHPALHVLARSGGWAVKP